MSKYLREFYEMDTIAVGEGLAVKKIEHDIKDYIYFFMEFIIICSRYY